MSNEETFEEKQARKARETQEAEEAAAREVAAKQAAKKRAKPAAKPKPAPPAQELALPVAKDVEQLKGALQAVLVELGNMREDNALLRERVAKNEVQPVPASAPVPDTTPQKVKSLPTYSKFVELCAANPDHEAAKKIAKMTVQFHGKGGAWKSVVKNVLDALRDLWESQ